MRIQDTTEAIRLDHCAVNCSFLVAHYTLAVTMLMIMLAQIIAASPTQSAAFDEGFTLTYGYGYLRARQFDVATSLIAPPGEAWYAIAENQQPAPELADLLNGLPVMAIGHTLVENPADRLSRVDLNQRLLEAAQHSTQIARDVTLPVKFGETAELIGYDLRRDRDQLTLTTYWRAGDHIITPLQMFVHVLAADSKIMTQADRLDASADDWRSGDLIAQVHRLDLPQNAKNDAVEIGLYDPETGVRLPVIVNGQTVDNRLVLGVVNNE